MLIKKKDSTSFAAIAEKQYIDLLNSMPFHILVDFCERGRSASISQELMAIEKYLIGYPKTENLIQMFILLASDIAKNELTINWRELTLEIVLDRCEKENISLDFFVQKDILSPYVANVLKEMKENRKK